MSYHFILAVGLGMIITTVALALALGVTRAQQRRRAATLRRVRPSVEAALRRWLTREDSAAPLALALDGADSVTARELLLGIADRFLDREHRAEISARLRTAPWVRAEMRRLRSPWWWRRTRAAHLLGVVATPGDVPVLRRLMRDTTPAVRAAAVRTVLQIGDRELVDQLLAGLGTMHPLVFGQVLRAIRDRPDACEASILKRLNAGTRGADLVYYIRAGAAVRTVAAFDAICRLADHPGWQVRAEVARALRLFRSPEATDALRALLRDDDWRVRAKAAASAATAGAADLVPHVADALHDDEWWVRYRAALALARFGPPGRAELMLVRTTGDRFAADMATMVGGLPDGALAELADAQ